jgi:S1-C subfamily serine protease
MSRSTPPHSANRMSERRSADLAGRRGSAKASPRRTSGQAAGRWCLAALAGVALAAGSPEAVREQTTPPEPANAAADAAFSDFFQARTPQEVASASDRIVASAAGFDAAFGRLRQGRFYSRDVRRGVVQGSYRSETGEYFYTLDVPQGYDSRRKYQVRVQLHGGVGRIEASSAPRSGSNGRLAGAEQIYVMPYAWREVPWWSGRQIQNLRAILDVVKRTYNVDENRVALSGVSDGGTGAYYAAMRDTTPFASVLPLNGFIAVLENETADADGDLFPHNLVNKPLFIVNGGRDPMYPTSVVDPYVEHLKRHGLDVDYRPQPAAAHDTSWWPEIKDSFERFVADHPRLPLPDTLTWESGPPNIPSRAHWMVIDRLAAARPDEPSLPDANRMSTPPVLDFGIRASGTRINRVVNGSNAEQIGLRSGDVVLTINGQPASPGTDVTDLLRGFPPGRPLLLSVSRGGESVRVTGRYAPTVLPGESDAMFPRQHESGRIDLHRTGNRVDAKSRGVAAFTLLLSPDQFELNRNVTVVVNGRTAFDGVVKKDIRTLLTWAARDNDRTMLFAAELPITVR